MGSNLSVKLEDFDYLLPQQLIAQAPLTKRDQSKLMVVDRVAGDFRIKNFNDVFEYINSGDTLVINDTKVFPARLFGKKNTNGKVEFLLSGPFSDIIPSPDSIFRAMAKSSKPLKVGQKIFIDDGLSAEVVSKLDDGQVEVRFDAAGRYAGRDIFNILNDIGEVPLPPYIKRDDGAARDFDMNRYQTVYANNYGAIAAPTAGFHFTDDLISRLVDKGVVIAKLTLHVGLGTFLPVRVDDLNDHKMHEEFFSIGDDCIEKVRRAKRDSKKVIAVGTTSVRALESAFDENLGVRTKSGFTDIFIYPGYSFKAIDALITNFHLPKSTLFMLVCAFGGSSLIQRAYKNAVDEKLRFFSYGDAMFIK